MINNDEVHSLLTMEACIESLENGYGELAQGEAVDRERIDVYVPAPNPQENYRWSSMEGASKKEGVFVARILSDMLYWQEGPSGITEGKYCRERGHYCGLLLVFSTRNGEPLAFINDGVLQHMRVGASAGLGARLLSRQDSTRVGILGSGGMARSYLEAICCVRKVKEAKVFSPSPSHREAYAREMAEKLKVDVVPVDHPSRAVHGSDVVACCTNSIVPVLEGNWLEAGMHVTDVTPLELDDEALRRADVCLKAGETLLKTSGGRSVFQNFPFLSYVAGTPEETERIPKKPRRDEFFEQIPVLTDYLCGKIQGRSKDDQVTFFHNHGTIGFQFAVLAARVYALAKARGMGKEFPTEWLLETVRD
jgi:alanine dehydrogenase